jgi:hypothetical protein
VPGVFLSVRGLRFPWLDWLPQYEFVLGAFVGRPGRDYRLQQVGQAQAGRDRRAVAGVVGSGWG